MYPIIYEFIPITFQIILPITVVIWGQYKYNKTYEGFEEKRKKDKEEWDKTVREFDERRKKDYEKQNKQMSERLNALKLR